ncbi:hypothetical protein PTSG_10094 [Salpingoeca rosetta]|uniref:Uncharacterized protein n=1 Tax=Salpingoeca rosetta (strain ATCC 50818 / BSB-021) TaxID=946362 RepID=F2UPG9_SALR5|nr:uncharacterized protein PTSG_10094 [Salpingoeca rosetta]EGD79524.1 hypothetical protein PTSG_10094 [Salpingoeca rosetta]|eukprot:XP_004989005.1 hypothetical protein PTSG_10094 [Salpingoeca rosetta]
MCVGFRIICRPAPLPTAHRHTTAHANLPTALTFITATATTHRCHTHFRLCLFLESNDETQCRFAVKNDDKPVNQQLASVQRQGYVEYKARYCKKRGQQAGYGYFHLAFRPLNTVIYPLQRLRSEWTQHVAQPEEDAVLYSSQVDVHSLERVIITVRLYQSFRGHFPTRSYHFDECEVYQSMYVKEWQDATRMVRNIVPGVAVETDLEGAYIQYIVHDASTLRGLCGDDGLKFPCPIPAHPERLNDVGLLRMQVEVKFLVKNATDSPDAHFIKQGEVLNAWVRIKVVQQLSGKKKRYNMMLRAPGDDWSMPPRPLVRPVTLNGGRILHHVVGKEALSGPNALMLLQDIACSMAGAMLSDDTDPPATTCMHEACRTGNMGAVLMLLQYRSTLVHVTDQHGNTPLHVAAMAGQIAVATLLYEAGARLHVTNKRGLTPRALADVQGSQAAISTLINFEERDKSGCSLFRAAAIGAGAQVIRLLKGHANPNDINAHGHTALFLAIDHNQPWTVHILVRRGASTRIYNKLGRMAIHQAAWRGDPETLVILLHEDPASIDLTALDGSTPLHIAAKRGHVLCVQILMSCGADLTRHNADKKTALDIAREHNNADVQLLLLKRGVTEESETRGLLSRAREGGSLQIAAKKGDLALTCKLLASGAMIEQRDADGNTALHLAARHGRFLVVDELLAALQRQGDTTARDVARMRIADGRDALHLACCKDSISSAIVLVSRKMCDVRARTIAGNTALHTAAENGQMFVAAFLRLSGINPSTQNNAGHTPLKLALDHCNVATASVLRLTDSQLHALSEHLRRPPIVGHRSGPSQSSHGRAGGGGMYAPMATGHVPDFIHLDALGQILSRLWHCTLEACRVLRTFRTENS